MTAVITDLDTAREHAARPDKYFATLQALMALAGGTVHRVEDDRGQIVFVVSRLNLTRELPTLDAVEAWITRLVGRA